GASPAPAPSSSIPCFPWIHSSEPILRFPPGAQGDVFGHSLTEFVGRVRTEIARSHRQSDKTPYDGNVARKPFCGTFRMKMLWLLTLGFVSTIPDY
ncbi:MAG: hypothetical protein ACLQBA_26275, partial [Candidatus Binataceae bacterium]